MAALAVLLVVVGPVAATASAGPATVAGATGTATTNWSAGTVLQAGHSCPATGQPKAGDVNGDGTNDWKLHEQLHSNGKLELWCIDGDPAYFAVVWVDESGTRHFVGKCPFGGGQNDGAKAVNSDGDLVGVTWVSVDRGQDDDGDGKTDDAIYQYYPANNTVIVKHSENGSIVEQNETTPEEPPFDFGDLPPADPSSDDFFAAAERPRGEFGTAMVLRTESMELTVAVNDGTTDEPLAGTEVSVLTTEGSAVDTLVTSEDGVATAQLPPGRYVLSVPGAESRLVDLRAFSNDVTVLASPAGTEDRIARLETRVGELERKNEALAERVDDLESENERLRENVTALRTEVDDLRSRQSGVTIPGFGLLLAAVALAAAAAVAGRSTLGRRRD